MSDNTWKIRLFESFEHNEPAFFFDINAPLDMKTGDIVPDVQKRGYYRINNSSKRVWPESHIIDYQALFISVKHGDYITDNDFIP